MIIASIAVETQELEARRIGCNTLLRLGSGLRAGGHRDLGFYWVRNPEAALAIMRGARGYTQARSDID